MYPTLVELVFGYSQFLLLGYRSYLHISRSNQKAPSIDGPSKGTGAKQVCMFDDILAEPPWKLVICN